MTVREALVILYATGLALVTVGLLGREFELVAGGLPILVFAFILARISAATRKAN